MVKVGDKLRFSVRGYNVRCLSGSKYADSRRYRIQASTRRWPCGTHQPQSRPAPVPFKPSHFCRNRSTIENGACSVSSVTHGKQGNIRVSEKASAIKDIQAVFNQAQCGQLAGLRAKRPIQWFIQLGRASENPCWQGWKNGARRTARRPANPAAAAEGKSGQWPVCT